MEVLGRRPNSGIWYEETLRSFRGVRGTLGAVIVDMRTEKAGSERMRLNGRIVGERCRNGPSRLEMSIAYVIGNMTRYWVYRDCTLFSADYSIQRPKVLL